MLNNNIQNSVLEYYWLKIICIHRAWAGCFFYILLSTERAAPCHLQPERPALPMAEGTY